MNFDLNSYDLTANTPRRINVSGRQVLIVEAAGNITLYAIRNSSRQGEIVGAPQGIAIQAAVGAEGFHGIEVESDQTETVKIAIADDEVDLSSISSSVTIASPLGPNSAVEVEDTAGNSFAELLALLKNANDQRTPLIDWSGATIANVVAGSSTEVSAVANANGVIIRYAQVSAGANSGSSQAVLQVGGVTVLRATGTIDDTNGPGAASADHMENVFVPAGNAIHIDAALAGCVATIVYEVL